MMTVCYHLFQLFQLKNLVTTPYPNAMVELDSLILQNPASVRSSVCKRIDISYDDNQVLLSHSESTQISIL